MTVAAADNRCGVRHRTPVRSPVRWQECASSKRHHAVAVRTSNRESRQFPWHCLQFRQSLGWLSQELAYPFVQIIDWISLISSAASPRQRQCVRACVPSHTGEPSGHSSAESTCMHTAPHLQRPPRHQHARSMASKPRGTAHHVHARRPRYGLSATHHQPSKGATT